MYITVELYFVDHHVDMVGNGVQFFCLVVFILLATRPCSVLLNDDDDCSGISDGCCDWGYDLSMRMHMDWCTIWIFG